MSSNDKPKRLFKVASEFNVSTSSIVDSLSEGGFEVDNKPNSKVTSEMYEVLEEVYGADKANSREHEKAKEDYVNRRNKIRAGRNESISIEDELEPLEDELPLKPKDEELPLEPQEEESEEEAIGGLSPLDTPDIEEETEEPVAEDKEPETAEEEPEAEVEEVPEKTIDETEEQQESGEKDLEEAVTQKDPEEVKEVSSEQPEEEVQAVTEETEDAQEVVSNEEEEEKTSQDAQPEEATESEEVEPAAEQKEETEQKEEEETPKEAAETEQEPPKEEKQEAPEEDEEEKETKEEGVIRGTAGRLKGTKVVGKVSIDENKPKKKRKKRKRKKDRRGKDADQEEQSRNKKKKSKKGKKKKRKRRGGRVDEDDVEQKLKETMRQMQSNETVGSRRQKRRRRRKEEREEEEQLQAELEGMEEQVIEVTEFITVSDLAERMDVKPNDVITTCMNLGMMVSINQRLDASTIELVADEFDYSVDFVDAEEAIEEIELEEDDPEDLQPRGPIITVMGHVDHGKTSLLDYIRKAKVASGEAGGITQHVGAYELETDGRQITFLDTPGHEAFTAMRSRGAQATDIVILVVAADDAVMPQTIEAINHSKAAGVSIIVAINKMDLPGANPDKIKQQLADHDVIVEEYGGNNQAAEVSAATGEGIDDLLEKVLIEAELMELKANPDRRADGVVLESRVDKGKGIVANILVQNGTLKVGDAFVAGPCFGRVRAMENEHGNRVDHVGPSSPVQLTGFDDIPQAGDKLVAIEDEKKAKEIATQRQQIRREQELRKSKHLTLDDLSRRLALGEVSDLNIIIKADVDGSIEALSGALQKLSNEEVSVNVIHTGAGAITESDVLLASASDAIIIGFQVRPTTNAKSVADNEEIDIRLFSVIYDAVDEVKDAMEGMLSPEISEQFNGNAEVREVFKVSNVGTIAGCFVTEGKINRNNPVRIVRDGVVIYDGEIDSLKRYKDDVKEVKTGYECGISIVNYNDIKVGDVIENYKVVEEKRKLEDVKQ